MEQNKQIPEFIPSQNTKIVHHEQKEEEILNCSQSVSSPKSNKSIMSPSISPMKLPSHSPMAMNINQRVQHRSFQSNKSIKFNNISIPTQPTTTRSLPNSPLIGVQSLAEISAVSLTPEFKAKNRRNQQRNKSFQISLTSKLTPMKQ